MSTASASALKCLTMASELSLGIRGGLTITAVAPAALACRLYWMQVLVPSALVPATTPMRPPT